MIEWALKIKYLFSFYAALRRAIDGLMFVALCPQGVSQAPQHFRSSETQGEHGWQKPSCVIPTARLIDIRQGSYSRHCGQCQNALNRLNSLQILLKVPGEIKRSRDQEEGGGAGP